MTPRVEKLCPVLLRVVAQERQCLAFRHPLAGFQLVKGTREGPEPIEIGALRELAEESGLQAEVSRTLPSSSAIADKQLWHFVVVIALAPLAEHWRHFTHDDGGHWFEFFWWPLERQPGPEWHPMFQRALAHIARHA
nr:MULTISPECIES: NUDIX domain-containing protein [unclassified Devosia]